MLTNQRGRFALLFCLLILFALPGCGGDSSSKGGDASLKDKTKPQLTWDEGTALPVEDYFVNTQDYEKPPIAIGYPKGFTYNRIKRKGVPVKAFAVSRPLVRIERVSLLYPLTRVYARDVSGPADTTAANIEKFLADAKKSGGVYDGVQGKMKKELPPFVANLPGDRRAIVFGLYSSVNGQIGKKSCKYGAIFNADGQQYFIEVQAKGALSKKHADAMKTALASLDFGVSAQQKAPGYTAPAAAPAAAPAG